MEFLIIFIFSLVPLLWFSGGQLILGHDSGFRLNYIEHLKNLFYSWHPNTNFGIDWSLYHGFIPIQLVETVTSYLTGSLVWGERLAFVWWFFAIGFSMVLFVRYFFPEKKFTVMRIIVPTYWMFNFYILQGWAIAERAKFSLYIALPLMIVIFFKTMRKEWSVIGGAITFGLLFFLVNGGGSPPLYGGILVTFALLVMYFRSPRTLGIIGAFGLCFILLNAYWILPQARLFTGNYAEAVSSRGGIEGLIAWEREITKYASITNILRLQGFPNWYNNPEHPYASSYQTRPLLVTLSFVPIVVVVLGLLFLRRTIQKKDRQILFFLGTLFVAGLFFSSGSHAPFGVIYTYLMRHVPGFAVFRSSLFKFAPMVYLPVIIFFGYFVSIFFDSRNRRTLTIGIIIACSIVFYHFPYLTANLFSIKGGFSTRVTVPRYVNDMADYLGEQTHPTDRILIVPALDVGFINSPIDTYVWGYYSLDVLPRIIVNRSFVANDSNDDSLVRLVYQSLQNGDEQTFLRLVQAAGITHVLWRGDVKLTPDTQKQMSVFRWEEALANTGALRLMREVGAWRLYMVESRDITPMVYAANSVSLINSGTTNDAYVVGRRGQDLQRVLLGTTDHGVGALISPEEQFIEAECFYCKQNEYTKVVEAFTLPVPFTVRRKNQIGKAIKRDLGKPQEIDARLSAASVFLSQKDIQSYQAEIQKIIDSVTELKDRERDVYSSRVMAYLDAHAQDTKEESIRSIQSLVWKAEDNTYRFGVTLPKGGAYAVWVPDSDAYARRFTADGIAYSLGDRIPFTSGYHRLALTAKNTEGTTDATVPVFLKETLSAREIETPTVTFRQENPTRYSVEVSDAKEPFVLILNQRFDNGWGLSIDGRRQEYYHTEANGFANAWIIPKTGTYELLLYYMPQEYVYAGAIVSGIALVLALSYVYAVFYIR